MNEKPRVGIVLLTFEPPGNPRGTASRVLGAALEHLRYSGPLQVHVADDGSDDPAHVARLLEIAGGDARVVAVTSSNAERGGYGRSYNLSTISTHDACEILLPLEDDWLLRRDLDLDPLVETLVHGLDGIRSIRLGYLGWAEGPFRGETVHTPAGAMLLLDPHSPSGDVFAGHPRLETRSYERAVGVWPENVTASIAEVTVGARAEARTGVAWPLDLGPASQRPDSLFGHIGAFSVNLYDSQERIAHARG